ncbi:hypothetical protein LguiA_017717 [Lonicera macranthoides]
MGRKREETALPTDAKQALEMESDPQIKSKKNKNRAEKRKHEETDIEPIVETKKEKKNKKNKKKDKEGESINNVSVLDSVKESGTLNGSIKKKKAKQESEEEKVEESLKNDNKGVVVSGKDANDSKYEALKSFNVPGLPKEVLECCKNFDKPSPIQSHSWPFLLDGRDLIGIAATGSGKTLAFGVPAMMHVLNKRKNNKVSNKKNPLCLVLSPTRELAQQIFDVLSDSGKPCSVRSVCIYGGTSKGPQISALKSGVDIVVGTPGRLKDLIEMGVCILKDVSFVGGRGRETEFPMLKPKHGVGKPTNFSTMLALHVLDEADRMLDMGFEPEVRSILSQTNSVRQMLMFSATWPPPVHQLAQEFMDPHPVKVVVGSEDLAANHDVMQIVEVLDDRARDERLVTLLEKYHTSRKNRVLVFVLYKKEASRVEEMLQRRGWKVVSISGDKAQHARTKALALFKDGSSPLLIATDVAARGLDIPDVEVVINYSFPLTTEDYVHRIGRTGRAGKKGVAHTFFTKENKALSGELINVLREAGQVVPAALMNFGTHVKKKESKLYGAHFREIDANAPKATKIKFDSDDDE